MVVVVLLVLLASPLVAEPPVVLFSTSASPVWARWLLSLLTLTSLLFVTSTSLWAWILMGLFGPCVVAELAPAIPAIPPPAILSTLATVAVVRRSFLILPP